ncbi:MAG: 50S ribosomal protein L7/L12 [Patescibacteria group bacterium]
MGEKIQRVVEEVEKLTVLELNELIKAIEDKFGVSGMMPTMMTQPTAGAPVEEGVASKVNVTLTACGDNKIQVIKALRGINPQLGLKEAKDITDTVPQVIKEGVSSEEAKIIKEKIETAGGKVELK